MQTTTKNFNGNIIRISIFLFVLFSNISISIASDIDTTKASLVGKNFILSKNAGVTKLKNTATFNGKMKLAFTMSVNGRPIYYIFNFVGQTGFMIISAEDNVQPILGYSFESNFVVNDAKPDAFQSLLSGFTEQIIYARENISPPSTEIKQLWNQYTSSSLLKSAQVPIPMQTYALPASVTPLLTTTWNQGCGYDAQCPADAGGPCGHTWAGCVAVSQGQVMKFWNYPSSGEGSKSYNHYKYGAQSADFGAAVYNWVGMPLNSGNADVAKFLYHVGVSVNMDYGITGSGAYMSSVASSLINYFKYTNNLINVYKSGYSELNWENLIKRELYEGRPVSYSGGTHAFVLDGYQSGNYFHVNWGWGGSCDGYFYLNNLKPSGYDFTSSQNAIIGVMPETLCPGVDVAKITTLSCGVAYNDSTMDGDNRVNKYGNLYLQTTGKEKWYSITTSLSGRLKVSLTGLNGRKLNLFILKYPQKDSLLAYGDSTAYLDKALPGKYYIAVDGIYGDEGKYSIKTICPNSSPDLTILKTQITPNFIQPYHSNVTLQCYIKNIGHSTAASSKLKFYYSVDKILGSGDIKIDSLTVGAINAGDSVLMSKTVNMPAVTSGTRYVLFVADSDNTVVETDENDNIASKDFQGVPPGLMNCSKAIALQSNVWYKGNTATNGDSVVSIYSQSKNYTGKEIIHSITAKYDGTATISFSEKIMGDLTCFILTGCNENLVGRYFSVYNKNDTMASMGYSVKKNSTYYFVVDGQNDLAGPYALRVTLPDSCPAPTITTYADTSRCANSGSAYLNAPEGLANYQWFKNGFPILNAIYSGYGATEDGSYQVQVSENGCNALSNKININYSPAPSGAAIVAGGDTTFCKGGVVSLNLTSATGYAYQWTCDNAKITGAMGTTFAAKASGTYRVEVTNQSCTLKSNTITVTAKATTADIGDTIAVSTSKLVTYYPFTGADDFKDMSGNSNNNSGIYCNSTYDRFSQYNHATYFDGLKSYMYTTQKFSHPDTITLSLWFKTNTNKGGRLIGLGNAAGEGLSTSSDRHIYMDNSGKMYFGVNNGTPTIVSSTKSYNDDKWHLVTATLSDKGMKLYVDTVLVNSRTTPTVGGAYTGNWKLGWDNLTGWPNKPDSAHFKGTLDEVRIYTRELSIEEVGILYQTKLLSVKVIPDMICQAKGKTKIYVYNSEIGATYQLRNHSNNANIGTAVSGTGGSIFLETDSISTNTSFNILAKNSLTGCDHQLNKVLNIIVNPIPAVSITSSATHDSIHAGELVTFTAHPVYGGLPKYEWIINGINAGSNQSTFALSTLKNNDSVSVVMTSSISCLSSANTNSNTIKTIVTTFIPTEILFQDAPAITVYPNPTEGMINIEFTGVTDEVLNLEILNANGQTTLNSKISDQGDIIKKIDLTGNPQGIYLIKIKCNKFVKTFKVMLQ